MEIKDLSGLGAPLDRLIKVISNAVGHVCLPVLTRRLANARAKEICTIAEAKASEVRTIAEARVNEMQIVASAMADVAKHGISSIYDEGAVKLCSTPPVDPGLILREMSIEDRTMLRLGYQERIRQENIENVAAVAAAELANDEAVPSEVPDDDWATRFFGAAQDISSEQLQVLWGRILAGEIRRPGSFSLRTLEFVRNLSRADAELFHRASKLALRFLRGDAFIAAHNTKWLAANRSFFEMDRIRLAEVGAMYPGDLQVTLEFDNPVQGILFGTRVLAIERGNALAMIGMPAWKFTDVGNELLSLLAPDIDDEYLEHVGHFYIARDAKASIGTITGRTPRGEVAYKTMRDV